MLCSVLSTVFMFSFLLSAIFYCSVAWCIIQKARGVWEPAELDD